jgi:hypothetical protein
VAKKKRLSVKESRRLAEEKRAADLIKLSKRAKALCKKAKAGEKPALALGRLLLKVKGYNPHGGLRAWIVENIGSDVSTRNRCNYAIKLAKQPNSKPPNIETGEDKTRKYAARVSAREVKEIRSELSILMMSVIYGKVGEAVKSRTIIMDAVDRLVKKTHYMAFKRSRKVHLDDLVASDDPQKRAVGQKAIEAEFNPLTLQAETFSAGRTAREKEGGFDSRVTEPQLDFTGRLSEDPAEKADGASAD